jgi:hypothetical protein
MLGQEEKTWFTDMVTQRREREKKIDAMVRRPGQGGKPPLFPPAQKQPTTRQQLACPRTASSGALP